MKFLIANRTAPDGMPHSAQSHLGLYCLLMSHKQDARLMLVKGKGNFEINDLKIQVHILFKSVEN